jgi:glycosyltransferase involved in cell wall biosynthesis
MRITILQGAFLPVPPLRGGAMEKLWFELGKQFSNQGHTVFHVSRSFPGMPDEEKIEHVQHLRIKGYDTPANGLHLKALDFFYSWRAFHVLPRADILITNTFWMPILAAGCQRRVGLIMVDVNRMPKGQMRLFGQSARLRAPSRAVQHAIAREAPRLASRIDLIPNPISLLPSHSASENYSREQVILYCGRLHPEKGINLLIQAYTLACEQGLSGWSLRLVGPADKAAGGGGQSWLEELLAQSPVGEHLIEWLGPIYEQEQLFCHYRRASIFVYPSLAEQGEALPIAPLEAMACGAVPIVSNLDCFRDFITPDLNGMVFNHRGDDAAARLASQILMLAQDCKKRIAMSEAAVSVCQSHNPATIAAEFLRCFEQMVEQRSFV